MFWVPERVVRGETFADVTQDGSGRDTGYRNTVIDQLTHLTRWFGHADADANGHKLNRINGVSCFAINDQADQWKFANTDGGLWIWTRRELLAKALDPDQEQLTLVFDDWEAFSGRSFTRSGWAMTTPTTRAHPALAREPPLDPGRDPRRSGELGLASDRSRSAGAGARHYDWLRHATEGSYANWFHGSTQEESFAALHLQRTPGERIPLPYGEVDRAGGLLHRVWQDVARAPGGRLRDLAGAVASVDLFETAWHDEDQNDYIPKAANGDYLHPDTSYDRISGWSRAMQARVGDASVVAAAARWSANPPATPRSWREDVDRDGEDEAILADGHAFYVFEDDGGRLAFAAVRSGSDAEAFVCSYLNAPGTEASRDRTAESDGQVTRVPGLVDWWATGAGSRYVNGTYTLSLTPGGLTLRSGDGRVTKRATVHSGSLTVAYTLDPALGTLYVRSGLAPAALDVFMGASLTTHATGEVSARTASGRTVRVALQAHNGARLNPGARFGGRGARGVPLQHQVEASGSGSFSLRLVPSLN